MVQRNMLSFGRLAPHFLNRATSSMRCSPGLRLSRRLASNQANPKTRIERINAKMPKFLQRFTTPLTTAPITHITAFLVLHEITAIVPLLGLFAYFHQTQYLPAYFSEGKWVSDGVEKFGRYFRKKGWLGEEENKRFIWWGRGEKGTRVVVEIATAYAITKLLLPLRIIISVWGTPWFARMTLIPLTGWVGRMLGRKGSKAPHSAINSSSIAPAAGTGAVGGGVVPANVSKGKELAK